MTCTEQNNEALDGPPVPSPSTPGSSSPIEVHVTLGTWHRRPWRARSSSRAAVRSA